MSSIDALKIRSSSPHDHAELMGLIAEAGLPLDGIPASMEGFIVAESPAGSIVGGAGLEWYGESALLRSVVVAPSARRTGLGLALTERAIAMAREHGIRNLYLLTTTAERFFPRFGFRPITRDEVPVTVQDSVEFRGACPDSAVIMQCSLT